MKNIRLKINLKQLSFFILTIGILFFAYVMFVKNCYNNKTLSIEEVVIRIAEEANVTSDEFFLISSDVCRTCLDETVATIRNKVDNYTNFVILGSDSTQLKALNAIYGRQRLRFVLYNGELIDQLIKIHQTSNTGIFLGARHKQNEKLVIYEGRDIPANKRIQAVIRYIYNTNDTIK